MRDISVRKREEERIRYLATYDTLTGLANRNTLREHLDTMLSEAPQSRVALLLIGIDKFKEVNDTLGHSCGDQVLRAVAQRLTGLVGGSGLAARVSGDEFAVVIADSSIERRSKNLAERAVAAFSDFNLTLGVRRVRVTCSIGVAIYPTDCDSAEDLLTNADLALYRAKATGRRGRCVFFDRTIRLEIESRLALEAELRRAADRDEFVLFYQPQFNLGTGALVGAEALLRWRHPERGLLAPGEFIAVLNASSMADDVAQWILLTACKQGTAWRALGHDIRMGVNSVAFPDRLW